MSVSLDFFSFYANMKLAFGLAEMSRSNLAAGGLPAIFFGGSMSELSIHVDESGDFGDYNPKYAPYYIFTLVFHEQDNDITGDIKILDREMANLGYFNHIVHTGPLIRKEEFYCNLTPNERRAIFTKLFYFAKKAPITYKVFDISRKEYNNEKALKEKINTLLSWFLDENLDYFLSFDRVVLYYDNGQPTLSKTLLDVFQKKLTNLYRKPNVKPRKYKLLQVADMICTLRLLEIKATHNELTKSEMCVFHSVRDLKKEFIKK